MKLFPDLKPTKLRELEPLSLVYVERGQQILRAITGFWNENGGKITAAISLTATEDFASPRMILPGEENIAVRVEDPWQLEPIDGTVPTLGVGTRDKVAGLCFGSRGRFLRAWRVDQLGQDGPALLDLDSGVINFQPRRDMFFEGWTVKVRNGTAYELITFAEWKPQK